MIAIEAKNLFYKYPDGTIGLRKADITVKDKECVAILGPTGCGKSTLLLILSGLIKPNRGYVKIYGRNINDYKNIRRDVAILFQNTDDFLFNQTVKDEIEFTLKQLNLKDYKLVENLIEKFKLKEILYKDIYKLSEGEKKKVALVTVLLTNPRILLLDEPTTFLDYNTKRELMNILKEMKKERTIVFTTHETKIVKELADKVVLMNLNKETVIEDYTDKVLNMKKILEECGIEPL